MTASVIRPAPACAAFGSMKERGVLVDLPQHLVPDATIRGPPEEPRVPVDAQIEIGYRDTGEKVGDRAHLVAVVTLPAPTIGPLLVLASDQPDHGCEGDSYQSGSNHRPCVSASHRSDATPPLSARWFGKPANRLTASAVATR